MKSAIALAALCGLALATPASAQFQSALDDAAAALLLDRLDGNLAVMAQGGKRAVTLLDDLLDPDASYGGYALGAINGFDSVSWRTDFFGVDQALFSLAFPERAAADRFRTALDGLAGVPPDPSCLSETMANWAVSENLSLNLRFWDDGAEHDRISVDLTVHGAPPQDANCSTTSRTQDDLVDGGEIEVFLARLVAEPPSFASAKSLAAWIAPYGETDIPLISDCDALTYIESPTGLGGISLMMASMPYCDGAIETGAYILLLVGGSDMFAGRTIAAVLQSEFGSQDACIEHSITYYSASKGQTLGLTDLSSNVSLMLFDIPMEQFGC